MRELYLHEIIFSAKISEFAKKSPFASNSYFPEAQLNILLVSIIIKLLFSGSKLKYEVLREFYLHEIIFSAKISEFAKKSPFASNSYSPEAPLNILLVSIIRKLLLSRSKLIYEVLREFYLHEIIFSAKISEFTKKSPFTSNSYSPEAPLAALLVSIIRKLLLSGSKLKYEVLREFYLHEIIFFSKNQ